MRVGVLAGVAWLCSACLTKGNPAHDQMDSATGGTSTVTSQDTASASGGPTAAGSNSTSSATSGTTGITGTASGETSGTGGTGGSTGPASFCSGSTGEAGTDSTTGCDLVDGNDSTQGLANIRADTSCGSTTPVSYGGTLETDDDFDWFRSELDGQCSGDFAPRFVLESSDPVEVCLYVDCVGAGTPDGSVTCEIGRPITSTQLTPGCCGVGAVIVNLDCQPASGGPHDATLWVSAGKSCSAECVPYGISLSHAVWTP